VNQLTSDEASLDDTSSSLNIVWLSGLSPLGVSSGLATYTRGLSESLAAAGNAVSGVGIGHRGGDVESLVRWTAVEGEPKSRKFALLSTLPYIAARLDTVEHRRVIAGALSADADVVVLDHLMSAWCLAMVMHWRERTGGVVVHVAHNHEGKVRRQWARHTPKFSKEGVYLRLDAARIGWLERKVLESADLVTTITLDDRRTIASMVDFERSIVLTPGWDGIINEGPAIGDRPRRVALLGSFDWHAKRENLEAVVGAFDRRFAQDGIAMVVVGSGDAHFLERQKRRWAATEFLGHVEDVGAVLDSSRLGIVAEPVGGGFKLKALDYAFRGLPMAVLRGSLAGVDLEPGVDVLSASSLVDLAQQIVAVIDDDQRLSSFATSARAKLESRHHWPDRGELLQERLRSIRSQRTTGATAMSDRPIAS